MRLSDAGLRLRRTKALYPNHRSPPWLTEHDAPRSLEPIVRGQRHVEPAVVGQGNCTRLMPISADRGMCSIERRSSSRLASLSGCDVINTTDTLRV